MTNQRIVVDICYDWTISSSPFSLESRFAESRVELSCIKLQGKSYRPNELRGSPWVMHIEGLGWRIRDSAHFISSFYIHFMVGYGTNWSFHRLININSRRFHFMGQKALEVELNSFLVRRINSLCRVIALFSSHLRYKPKWKCKVTSPRLDRLEHWDLHARKLWQKV